MTASWVKVRTAEGRILYLSEADLELGGGVSALDDLSDVTLGVPSGGEVLMYDGAAWVNSTSSSITAEDVRDTIGGSLVEGENVDITVSDPSDTITIAAIPEWNAASGAGPSSLEFFEDTDNGTNKITVTGVASVASDKTLTLPDATDTLVARTTTDTLTNKRITARVSSEVSSATPTINTDNVDIHKVTALATNITSMTTNLSGTPTDGQQLRIVITASGGTRTIAWGTSFEDGTAVMPTALTVAMGRADMMFVWNAATSKWRCQSSERLVTRATNGSISNVAIDLGSNTVTGSMAQFDSALTDDNFVYVTAAQTIANKRITPRPISTASDVSPTINTNNCEIYYQTALAGAITISTSGTPQAGQSLQVALTDDGTARGITWNASNFEASGTVTLPTTTVISTRLDVMFTWNPATSKWRIMWKS